MSYNMGPYLLFLSYPRQVRRQPMFSISELVAIQVWENLELPEILVDHLPRIQRGLKTSSKC